MVMYKKMNSDAVVVIAGNTDDKSSFQPGFRYMMDGVIYTVREARCDSNTEVRRVITRAGVEEILTVASIRKDLQAPGTVVMEPDPMLTKLAEQKPADDQK